VVEEGTKRRRGAWNKAEEAGSSNGRSPCGARGAEVRERERESEEAHTEWRREWRVRWRCPGAEGEVVASASAHADHAAPLA